MDVKTYSDELVEELVRGQWESLMDAELRALTRTEFERRACTGHDEVNAEALEDAWYEFTERRDRVFG